ncbi:MAG: pentapeptide repeat-containing protein [Acidobacteria bacterium]|nr:pentapeptide repeat-containing protein [Acidobacteriota bacterium]
MAEFTRDDVLEKVRNHISLEFADLRGLDLRGIDFRKANLSGAEMSDTRLNGSRLGSANLQKSKLYEADLTTVDLSGANLSGANLQKANMVGANLSHAILTGASLRFADLSGATLAHADLSGADLVRAKCREADLREAILTDADLSSAFLRGALLRGANFTGANIEGAVGLDPTLTNATMGMPMLDLTNRGGRRPGPITLGYGAAGAGPAATETPGAMKRTRVMKEPKPSKYHAELRRVPSVIFTPNGWIRGVFHVPVMHGFLEHLNLVGEFLKLTDVTLPDLKLDLKFFGLRRSKALIVLPDCDPKVLALPQITADYTVHRVTFLMEGGSVEGSLAIEEDIRLSDYLTNHDHFVLLKNCRFGAYDSGPEDENRFPFLLVNLSGVIGASDERIEP